MAEPFKTLWKEATLAILFGTLLIILLAGFIVFLDWHMDSVLTCIKRCLKWCLMWAFILVIIVPASVLGFVLLVVAVVLVVVGVLGLVMLEAGVEVMD